MSAARPIEPEPLPEPDDDLSADALAEMLEMDEEQRQLADDDEA